MTRKRKTYTYHFKLKLYEKQNGKCCYCNQLMILEKIPSGKTKYYHATIKHVVPLGLRGKDHKDNIKLACYKCNQEWAEKLIPNCYLSTSKLIKHKITKLVTNNFYNAIQFYTDFRLNTTCRIHDSKKNNNNKKLVNGSTILLEAPLNDIYTYCMIKGYYASI